MNPPPNREVDLFSAALELPASQRGAYLREACADDPALRLRIEALLRDHEAAGAFLETPPPGAEGSPIEAEVPGPAIRMAVTPSEKAGSHIGRYKLLQQIGEGGCGVVYMAEQEEPVRRKVALKIIKLGMDTESVIARFEAERQALALMDHPNIAKVLDAGATHTGRPYFVMELVRGIKITDYCDQNNLSTQEQLELFIQVCRAIQHAHQKGIIHRDIKPSNILVTVNDGVPVPKVIDFGIAKATQGRLTDQTLFTAFEQFIGTPAYMSPEQAVMTSLDIDTRSDIYSLGVLLYELLTGRTPFDQTELLAAGLDEMRRTIREKEPLKPSTRLTQELVAADVRRRTSGEPEPSAALPRRLQELIHVLRGDLDWIVMKALEKDRTRRYDTANGLAMDIQRYLNCEPVLARPPSRLYEFQKTVRRHKFGFAAAAAIITVLAGGVVVSTWEAVRATRAERQQIQLRELAQAEQKKAQIETSKSQQEAQFLEDMLTGNDPDFALGEDTTLLLRILDKTVARVTNALTAQPEVQGELLNVSGWTYWAIGDRAKAEAALRQALQIQRKVLKAPHPDLAETLVRLAQVLAEENQPQESEARFRESLEMRRKLYGDEHPAVADCLNNLSGPLMVQGKTAEAEAVVRQALAIKRKLFPKADPSVAISLRDLGLMLRAEGRPAEAERLLREALAMFRKTLGDVHSEVVYTLEGLGTTLHDQGKFAEAENCDRQALELKAKLYGKDHWQGMSASAELLMREGHFAEGAADYARVIELRPDDVEAWDYRAIALFASGQLETYRNFCHKSLQRFAKTTDVAAAERIAKDYLMLPCSGPDLETAAAMLKYAMSAGSNHQYSIWFRLGKGLAEYRQGRYDDAVDWMQQVLEHAGPIPERDAAAWLVLAMAQHQLKQTDHARVSLIKGREIINTTMPTLEGRDLGENWDDWVIAHALLKEAKALIESPSTPVAEPSVLK